MRPHQPPYAAIAHPVSHQAFQDITTFIDKNGFDCDKFCATMTPQHNLSPQNFTAINNSLALSSKPLLQENPHRFVLFPIQHPDIWHMYKKAKASFWTVKDINLTTVIVDWSHLSDNKRQFISHILAFFAALDGIVNKNLCHNFATEITTPEAQCFYGFQITVENIHNKMYSLLIDTYIKDPTTKLHILRATKTIPCVHHKATWALTWCDPANASFAKRIIAFAAVEGIFCWGLSAPYFGSKNVDLCLASASETNSSAATKGLHCNFA